MLRFAVGCPGLGSSGRWSFAVAVAVFCSTSAAQTQNVLVLKDVRLASRLGTDHILIRSGYGFDGNVDFGRLPPFPGYSEVSGVPAAFLARFLDEHPSNWRSGDRWRIYTGAGKPVTVSIQDLALEGHGDGSAAVVAVAQFPDEDTANRVFGLRASVYLAVPGLGIDETPDRPLMPDDYFEGVVKLEHLLKAHGAAIVKQRQAGNDGGSAEALKLDKAFLDAGSFAAQTHISRWNPQGGKPLLFAEIVWQSKDGEAVFAANAIVEQGQTLEILDFDSRPAEQMRVPYNEKADTWHSYVPVFLNAWVLGTHQLVLKYTQYYEGFSVDLMELVPGKGLLPTGLSYGDGA